MQNHTKELHLILLLHGNYAKFIRLVIYIF